MNDTQRTKSGEDEDRPEPEVDTRCGYRSCKPEGLQLFNKPRVLLACISILCFAQGFAVNGVNNVNIQSVERRFHLSSSKSSLIASSYDFSAAIFGLVFGFLGSGRYKARWLAAGSLLLGLGSFTMALPHFTTGLYVYEAGADLKTCNNVSRVSEHCESEGIKDYLYVLILGMVLHGVGGGILYTVGIGVLDDSVNAHSSPKYLGVFFGAATLGPGLGFIIGGQFLNYYVDFDKVDQDTVDLSREDPRWIGAWWLAFFVTMTMFFLTTLPLSCFGAELPSAKEVRETRTSQIHKDKADSVRTGDRLSVTKLPMTILTLLRNPVFTCLSLAGACDYLTVTGFSTFAPKYVQNHFSVSSGSAAIYTGIATIPGAAGGMLFGGWLSSRLKLTVAGNLKLILILTVLAGVFTNVLWLKCDDGEFAGVNMAYNDGSSIGVEGACNVDCGCSTRFYDAVCHDDAVQYFSACHAGCADVSDDGKTFYNCSCLPAVARANVTMVTEGRCTSGCTTLYVFIVVLFATLFFWFAPAVPGDSAILRSIKDEQRTFSMGLERLIGRLIGTVPGPVVFGALTDVACKVWETECGEDSSCWVYDTFQVSRNYFIVMIALKFLSFILYALALYLYKPPKHSADDDQRMNTQAGYENKSFQDGITDNQTLPENYVKYVVSTDL